MRKRTATQKKTDSIEQRGKRVDLDALMADIDLLNASRKDRNDPQRKNAETCHGSSSSVPKKEQARREENDVYQPDGGTIR